MPSRFNLKYVAVTGLGALLACAWSALAPPIPAADDAPAVSRPPASGKSPLAQAKPKPSATEPATGTKTTPAPAAAGKSNPDEKAIRATADEFTKAFNAADAKAIGRLWAAEAEYTDADGKVLTGRDAIQQEYANLFKERAGASMVVAIESIRFIAPDVAIEKGVAKVKFPASEGATASRYTVTHVKRDGAWQMTVARDDPYTAASNEEYLQDLGWLIGEWSAEGLSKGLRIKCEWIAQKNFIRNTFTTVNDDKTMLTGVEVIGWNPKLQAIVSWQFDAGGGFGDDVWSKDGSQWVIEAHGTSRDGSESSAVNLLTPIDANSFGWQSVRRTIDGAELPDTKQVKMVRIMQAKASNSN